MNLHTVTAGSATSSSSGHLPQLLTPLDAAGHWALVIDNSSTETITTCPTQGLYSKVLGRTSEEKAALVYGSAVHAGLEVLYARGWWDSGSKPAILQEAKAAAFAEFEGFSSPFHDEWRTAERACHTLDKYLETYENEPYQPRSNAAGKPLVEVPFNIQLGTIPVKQAIPVHPLIDKDTYYTRVFGSPDVNPEVDTIHVFWSGKIDLVAEHLGATWIVDHKTSSIIGPSYFKDFELSQQTIGYTWAGTQILGERVKGLLLNVLACRKPTRTGKPTEFHRRQYHYENWKLEQWPGNTLQILADFIGYLVKGHFPQFTKWCVGKYGVCPYHDVCSMNPRHRQAILFSGTFRDNLWSPLK